MTNTQLAPRIDAEVVDSAADSDSACDRDLPVLIVDADEGDRERFCEALRNVSPDIVIVVCGNLETASYLFETHNFSCVLLDYHLLGGVARGHILEYQQAANDPHLPVIIVSSYGSESKAASAMRHGAADYLVKDNVTEHSLRRAIRNSVSKAQLHRSLDRERQSLELLNTDLLQKNREVQSFYHTVSHELKTPLTAIREYCSLVHDGILGETNPDQLDAMSTALDCCDRLTRLVNDLFDAARVETGKFELNAEPTEIVALLKSEHEVLNVLAKQSGIELVLDVDANLPLCEIDGARVRQVVSNLVRNAIKFTASGGEISMSARPSETQGMLQVCITDNGYGIASEHAEHIFDRLYQCDPIGETSQNGMGIGLYLCSQIVHQHNGTIDVESELGEGSAFTFTLPTVAGFKSSRVA